MRISVQALCTGPCGPRSSAQVLKDRFGDSHWEVWRDCQDANPELGLNLHTNQKQQFTTWSARKSFLKRDRIFQRLPHSFKAQKVCLSGLSQFGNTASSTEGPTDVRTPYEAEQGASLSPAGEFCLHPTPSALAVTGSKR